MPGVDLTQRGTRTAGAGEHLGGGGTRGGAVMAGPCRLPPRNLGWSGRARGRRLVLEAYTTLGHLSSLTRRVRLGAMVSPVTFREPALLVKAVTTLDVLSGGRAWLGLGAGYHLAEAEMMGLPLPPTAERFDRMEETLQLAHRMWAGDDTAFEGTHYRVMRPLNSSPALTRPRPPMSPPPPSPTAVARSLRWASITPSSSPPGPGPTTGWPGSSRRSPPSGPPDRTSSRTAGEAGTLTLGVFSTKRWKIGGVMTDSCASGADRDRSCRRLLAFLGTAMIATGQPMHEVEDELREVGRHLGSPDVQVAAGPTGVHVGLASGEPATFESVDGRLRLDQAVDVRLIRHLLVTDRIDVEQALEPAAGPAWQTAALPGVAGRGRFRGGGRGNLPHPAAGLGEPRRGSGGWRHRDRAVPRGGFAPFSARAAPDGRRASWCPLWSSRPPRPACSTGALRTVLPPLAVLLPGALMVTGLSELAAGAMVAGSSRLMYGTVQLLLFALGVAAAAALLGTRDSCSATSG